jgi:hypothetical protein
VMGGRLEAGHRHLACVAGGHPACRVTTRRDARLPHSQDGCAPVSPKTSQIILDKVVVLDKDGARFNAPLASKITVNYPLSATYTSHEERPLPARNASHNDAGGRFRP